jgi:hypothetical protein
MTNPDFDEDRFGDELGKRIALELNGVKWHLRYDIIRALGIDCFPWHGWLILALLTAREEYPEKEFGKWAMSDWRYYDFTSTPSEGWPHARDLTQQMKEYFAAEPEDQARAGERADRIYRACAKALLSPHVSEALKFYGFKLARDFEFGVFHPDYPERGNYCDVVRGSRPGHEQGTS